MRVTRRLAALAALIVLIAGWAAPAAAAESCAPRGKLDPIYCDENGDGIADPPKDAAKLLNPDTLVFAYVPVEDPAVYGPVFGDLLRHLEKVTGKKVQYFGF
jgi:phosphonate transport system substrate-binding protein